MRRYPYTLEMLYETDAILNSDGSWTEGVSKWVYVCPCNASQNGRAQEISLSDGSLKVYSFEVTMPSTQKPIPINTQVRIVDYNGINIFDDKPKEESAVSYRVLSNKLPKQRHEKSKLWL